MARKKKKTFAVGDNVYAINPHGDIISASIKAIDPDGVSPYELNIKSRLRFYTADDLYSSMEEAKIALAKEDGARIQKALDSGNPATGCVPCGYDKKTHTFLDGNGNRISEYFELPPDLIAQYSKLVSKVSAFCHKHSIPMITIGCMRKTKKEECSFLCSSILPSMRVPGLLWDVDDMFHDSDEEEG